MIKKIGILALFLLAVPTAVFAHGTASKRPADEIIKEIHSDQNLKTGEQINCEDVSNSEWEELGDSVMDMRHPDGDEHSFMDEMMGGEGSESLDFMHINMGKGYAKCGYDKEAIITNRANTTGFGMMDESINDEDQYGMMSTSYSSPLIYSIIAAVFGLFSFIALIIILVIVLVKKKK